MTITKDDIYSQLMSLEADANALGLDISDEVAEIRRNLQTHKTHDIDEAPFTWGSGLGTRNFAVESETVPGVFYVVVAAAAGAVWTPVACTCPDFVNRRAKLKAGPGRSCKHMDTV